MKNILLSNICFLLLTIFNQLNAQPVNNIIPCGTVFDKLYQEGFEHFKTIVNKNRGSYKTHVNRNKPDTIKLKITITDPEPENEFYSLTFSLYSIMDSIYASIDLANQLFEPIGIFFEPCEQTTTQETGAIDDGFYTDFLKPLHKEDYLNIYFGYPVFSGNNQVGGYANYPFYASSIFGLKSYIVMSWFSTGKNDYTLTHELGHTFGLIHTHGDSLEKGTIELVNGCNCATAADEICDTPADPNLANLVDYTCTFSPDPVYAVDINNEPYQPLLDNIMSYTNGSCRKTFTNGQYERMFAVYHIYLKNNLHTAKYHKSKNIQSSHLPSYMFINSPPVLLPQVDGNYIGSGISSGTFNPKKAGTGEHLLEFERKTASLISNRISVRHFESLENIDTVWQSFKANHTGLWYAVSLPVFFVDDNLSKASCDFTIYEGIGIKGPILYEDKLEIELTNLEMEEDFFKEKPYLWKHISLPDISIEKDNNYTIELNTESKDSTLIFGLNQTYWHDSLDIFCSHKIDTFITKEDTFYHTTDTIIYVPEFTRISKPDTTIRTITGDTLCGIPDKIDTLFYLGGDTTFFSPADTLIWKPDTVYQKTDTTYNQYALGLSTFVYAEVDTDTTYICPDVRDIVVKVLQNPVTIFPNPVIYKDWGIFVEYIYYEDFKPYKIELLTLGGKVLQSKKIVDQNLYYNNKERISISSNDIPSGVYLVSVSYEEAVFSQKLIKL